MSAPTIDMAKQPKVSADAHVNEPHDLWYRSLPPHLRDLAPHRIESDDDGGWSLLVNGEIDESTKMPRQQARQADEALREEDAQREADASLEVRLESLRRDSVNAEIIYPTIGLYVFGIEDPRVGIPSCQVYNDWIHDKLGDDNPRVRYAALIPSWGTEEAISEVQRVASWPGVSALMLPLVGSPSWNQPDWEPLWAAIAETGLPIVMHQGTGHSMVFYRGWGSPTANLLASQSMAPRAAALFACSGVLERHPDMHLVLVEVNAGWIPWSMSTLDEYFVAHRAQLRKPHLPELPSVYLRRQVHATFQRDPIGIANRAFTGLDCLMWGNDFPHGEGTYPHSNEVLTELLQGVSASDVSAIVAGNALRVFGVDPVVLESPA